MNTTLRGDKLLVEPVPFSRVSPPVIDGGHTTNPLVGCSTPTAIKAGHTMTNGENHTSRRTLGDQVFDTLFREILAGDVPIGGALLPERALAERHGVNRQVVREAVKRLEQLGLVSCGQGDGNRVRDWRVTGGFDLLPLLAAHSVEVPGSLADQLVRSLLEMRMAIGTDAARLAAVRADPSIGVRLRELGLRMSRTRSTEESVAISAAFWSELIDASGNIAYRLHFNTLTNASEAIATLVGSALMPSLGDADGHGRLADAVAAGDAAAAVEAAAVLLRQRMPDRAPALDGAGVSV
jgi:GntR family transcriptional regulator, transcriptional repressor for pyruvate dehydrogenase complex